MFPERLKDLRKEKGMTQIELATALGVSSGTVAMWETGKRKPSFEMFEKLTQVLINGSIIFLVRPMIRPQPN